MEAAFATGPGVAWPSLSSARSHDVARTQGPPSALLQPSQPTGGEQGSSWPTHVKLAAAALGATIASNGALRSSRGRKARRGAQAASRARPVRLPRVALKAETDTLEAPATDTDTEMTLREDVRNIAIIAHVDHGKTTLVDKLMQQCFDDDEQCSMDSDALEMERGITIMAKNAALRYKGVKVNLIDTPGHADFGGEVERILNMADCVLLLVDAQEGPMPQTKFVLRQALKLKLPVIVCINKVDKPSARPDWVLDATFDLFTLLGADDETCDFPVVYASGIRGVSSTDSPDELEEDLKPLLDMVLSKCPKPRIPKDEPLQMLISNLDYDDYIGRICIGRLRSGKLQVGQKVGFMYGEDGEKREATVSKLWEFMQNGKQEVEEIHAGDICAFTGMSDVTIGDTVVDPSAPKPLPPIVVEEPTVAMEFSVSRSPFKGLDKESKFLTASLLKTRLEKEALSNLALRVNAGITSESFEVKGRGTLQLGILIENMRREGFELMVGPPQVLLRENPDGPGKQEPYEEAVVEVPEEFQGAVLEEMSKKNALMKAVEDGAVEGLKVLTFEMPTRALIGMQGKLMNRTRGQGVLTSRMSHWGPYLVDNDRLREKGSIVNVGNGKTTEYQLVNLKHRGSFFVNPASDVYDGMVVGIHNKEEDMSVNMTKEKKKTNVRANGREQYESYPPPLQFSIDDYLGHMDSDEMLEITPKAMRLLKRNAKGLRG
eukprot:TRINITY_DN8556_c0_g1_i5.p1 TRINITY_DN8556_c0_g1~~TRINITY_DN8556_c0_g1_i5.p1  ORF type:complete len:741 (-),score=218.74 TRINITY_DN8556_c0_g1_i5:593-2743(-)